jgi:hypothetical protein
MPPEPVVYTTSELWVRQALKGFKMKSGYKTSEFYLTLLANILAGAVVVGLVPETGSLSKLVALIIMVLGNYGYTRQRTELKEKSGGQEETV